MQILVAGFVEAAENRVMSQRKEADARKKKRRDIIPKAYKPADLSGVV